MAKRLVVLLALLVFFSTTSVFADTVSITDMIKNPQKYDGKVFTIKGEVIGDIMKRGNDAWVNISDGNNALGIWIPYNMTKDIKYKGSYADKGDMVEVQGRFNRVCKEHGGDMDFHVNKVNNIEHGGAIKYIINKSRIMYATIMSVIVIILLLIRKHLKALV